MYAYKDPYIIDFSSVKHYSEVHLVIKEALDFPDYYGCNLDALWDCLTDISGEPFHVEIYGFDKVEQVFEEKAQKLLEVFADLKEYRADKGEEYISICLVDGEKKTYI